MHGFALRRFDLLRREKHATIECGAFLMCGGEALGAADMDR
jgi:hypothetical protein